MSLFKYISITSALLFTAGDTTTESGHHQAAEVTWGRTGEGLAGEAEKEENEDTFIFYEWEGGVDEDYPTYGFLHLGWYEAVRLANGIICQDFDTHTGLDSLYIRLVHPVFGSSIFCSIASGIQYLYHKRLRGSL